MSFIIGLCNTQMRYPPVNQIIRMGFTLKFQHKLLRIRTSVILTQWFGAKLRLAAKDGQQKGSINTVRLRLA
jgi:hypothetical protein